MIAFYFGLFPPLTPPRSFFPPLSPQPPFHPRRGGKGEPDLTACAGSGNIGHGHHCGLRFENSGHEFRAPETGGAGTPLHNARDSGCGSDSDSDSGLGLGLGLGSSRQRSARPCRAATMEAAPTAGKGRSVPVQSQRLPISPLSKARDPMRLPSSARRGGRGAGGSEGGKNTPAGATQTLAEGAKNA